jgi:AAA+ superfamily predicted ATPase
LTNTPVTVSGDKLKPLTESIILSSTMKIIPERERQFSNLQQSSMMAQQRFVTGSQAAAVPCLEQLYRIGLRQPSFSGITPRTKPLLVGPSGCGNTATVRMLAEKLKLETLSINAGSWIVHGAYHNQYSLTVIRDFIHRQQSRGGLILVLAHYQWNSPRHAERSCVATQSKHRVAWAKGADRSAGLR